MQTHLCFLYSLTAAYWVFASPPLKTSTLFFYQTLETDELEGLYYSYETENIKDIYHRLTAKRNKIIVGLIVYQGLNTSDLSNLEVENVPR